MKKILLFISAAVMSLTFFSCIEEDGAGVPMPKSLFVEHAIAGDTVQYNLAEGADYLLRWHGLENAEIKVELANELNYLTQGVNETIVPGDLNTCSMTIPAATIADYVEAVKTEGLASDKIAPTDDRMHVLINVTATPIDLSLPTGLPEKGKTQTVLVRIVDESLDD